MLTIEEITAWSDDQILAELKAAIPKDCYVAHGWDAVEGYWRLEVFRMEEDGTKVVLSEEHHPDGRLILLNAYGQYWIGSQKPPKDSPWERRHGELSREFVTQRVTQAGSAIPDPEDLDPTEIDNMIPKQEI